MTTHKEHHYVPQFYFRNFSHHPKHTTIHALLKRLGIVKFDVSIKKQGKRHKLYLTQEIETAISQIESGMSNCFRSIILNVADFPELRASQPIFHQMACAFLLQAGRTPARGERYHNTILPLFEEWTISQLLADPRTPSEFREDLDRDGLRIDYDYRHDVLNMTHLALIAPILFFDMTMTLLVNATPLPLIFSDSPAISTNLLLWNSRGLQGIAGYGSRGLIAFMPLCERLALMFFDGGAYSLRSPATNPVYLNAIADVGLLNAFQLLAADDVIYFGDKCAKDYIERLYAAHHHAFGEQVMVTRKAQTEDGRSELVHYFERVSPLRPDFSFLRLRRVPTDDDLQQPRNDALVAMVERLTQASITRDPAFTQKMLDTFTNELFVRTTNLRTRS
jgi:hypothetical protein